MPLKWVLLAVTVLAFSAGLVMTAPIPTDTLPEPIPTRQDMFEIPFRIPPVQDPADTPVNVRLYVSSDSGISYKLHSTVEPGAGKFVFRAPHDGEYWFLIRTVDAANRVRPEGNRPELRVVVDTMLPRLDLQAARGPSGEVVASWQMLDANLQPETLKLEFQVGSNPTWSAVALDPAASVGTASRSGKTSWFVPGSEEVRIRAQVSDLAGNLGRTTAAVQTGGGPAVQQSIAGASGMTSGSFASHSNQSNQTNPANNAANSSPSHSSAGAITTSSGKWPASPSDVPWNRDLQSQSPAVGPSGLPTYASQQQNFTPSVGSNQSQLPAGPALTSPGGWPQIAGTGGAPAEVNPPIASQYESSMLQQTSGISQDYSTLLPPGERPRMVSGRSFEMEYEVDSIGPSGIARVELFGSRDGGRTWTSYGVDPDSRSPMRINVDGEGLYGFRIAVQSGSGLGGAAPQPGDAPEVWVGVDLTKPNARFLGAEAGAGDRIGELVVRWEALDASLASRPIALYFSPQPNGPWYPIAAGLENTGSYGWRLDNRIPPSVYLRLEVRDEAGNVTVVDSPIAVTLEQVQPTGRIRNVRPSASNDSARGPKEYRFY